MHACAVQYTLSLALEHILTTRTNLSNLFVGITIERQNKRKELALDDEPLQACVCAQGREDTGARRKTDGRGQTGE